MLGRKTIIEFREELLSLIEEADGDNIGVNDLICMMLQIGASDPSLRRELGSIKNPTFSLVLKAKGEGYPPLLWRSRNLAVS